MPRQRSFGIEFEDGRVLYGVVDFSEQSGPRPTIVVCHGYKGFYSWGFNPYLAELLSARGFTVVRFNFTGAGMMPDDDLVSDPEAFKNATFSKDVEELEMVLQRIGNGIADGAVDTECLGLLGFSRGGGTAILASIHPDLRERLRALVTWSSVSTFERLNAEQIRALRRDREIPVVNSRTGQKLAMGRTVLEDLEAQRDRLDILAAAGQRVAPWLILHGEKDETVDVAEAKALRQHAAGAAELMTIPGATHTYGAQHPFTGPTPQLTTAMNATQGWFRRYLRPKRD